MNHILNGTNPEKKLMYFNSISHLDIRHTHDAGRERFPFLLNINMLQNYVFQFDPIEKKFYIDEDDYKANVEDMEKALEESKDMTNEEKEEHLKGRGKLFIQRQEYILMVGEDNLAERISKLVELI